MLIQIFIASTTPLGSSTSETLNCSTTMCDGLQTSCDQVTPVGNTLTQQSPLTDVSNGKFLYVYYANRETLLHVKFVFNYAHDYVFSWFRNIIYSLC